MARLKSCIKKWLTNLKNYKAMSLSQDKDQREMQVDNVGISPNLAAEVTVINQATH